jgi:hypothetical protein
MSESMNIQKLTVKTMAILSLSILVILGLTGCVRAQNVTLEPKTDETAVLEPTTDKNIYKNEKYGYTIMYPTDCYFGQMPGDCKEKPPEARRAECLCFLDSTNPDRLLLNAFLGDSDQLSLAQFVVAHNDSPVFNPPQGTELVRWINKNFSDMFEDIPGEPNMNLNGILAVRVLHPRSPQSPGFENIYILHNDLLFEIQLLDVDNESNLEFYDQMLSTFSFEE